MAGIRFMRLQSIYRLVFWFLIVSFPLLLFGQLPVQSKNRHPQKEMYFKHLTREDGLPSNVIRYIINDVLGYLWIATDNGLVRYDGKEMKVFRYIPGDTTSLAESSISVLKQTSDSMIWIGTKNGLSILDPFTEKIINYQHKQNGKEGFCGEWILSFYEDDDGIVWIGTNGGIIKADLKERTFRLTKLHLNEIPDNRENLFRWVNNIAPVPHDNSKLFLATRGGLLLFDKLKLSVLKDFGADLNFVYPCSALFIDGDSLLWTGAWDTGLKKFDLKTETWSVYNPANMPNLNILDIIIKNKNELWLGTVGNGLGIFNKKNQTFQFFKNDPGNPRSPVSNWVHGNLIEHENAIWLLTNSCISISDPQYRSFHLIDPQLSMWYITGFYRDTFAKRFYISGTGSKGLNYWDELSQKWQLIKPSQELAGEALSLYSVLRDSNGLTWINSNRGLLYIDNYTNRLTRFLDAEGEPVTGNDTVFFLLFEDSRRNLWIGTRFDGVIKIDPTRSHVKYYQHDTSDICSLKASRDFKAIREDRFGRIWFGCYNGITVYDPGKDCFYNPVDDYLTENGMDNRVIWGIETDTLGRIYLSVDDEGLLRITEDEYEKFEYKLFYLDHGLNDLNLFKMDRDPSGNIWIINEGISRFDPYHETFHVFDTRNGLHTNKNWNHTIYIDEEGNIFLNDGRTYETINIEELITGPGITNLIVECIEINNEIRHISSRSKQTEKLVLKPFENDIELSYKAICFGNSDQVKYKYWMEGYDKEWKLAGNETTARYTNLSPGKYVLYVNAAYRGIWEDQTIKISITIKPYFWQTWWFITLTILFLIALIAGIIKWRSIQIRRKERLKSGYQKKLAELEMEALRAQMNPHFIFNSLNSINNFILKNESEQASDFLVKFSRLVRQVLNNSKNKYVTLLDEIKALNLYLELEQLRFEYQFDYEINCDEDLDRDLVMVPPLIIQPYVENAIWHGLMHKESKGKLTINIQRESELLRFEIVDDGIGREKSKEYKSKFGSEKRSMGLSITKDRISILNRLYNLEADMKIIDLYDEGKKGIGTRVIVKIPHITKQDLSHENIDYR